MYAVVKIVNGAFAIHAETDDLNSAKTNFHGLCQALWNASDVLDATVSIVDEHLHTVETYIEYIHHDAVEP